jgi:hypothetical protein
MAEPTQFAFSLQEVTKALIKQQGLHDGKWVLALEFGFGAGFFGQEPEQVRPGALLTVQRIYLAKHPENAPVHASVVDAGEINPPS